MGNRGFAGKWSHYEESLRVPLIIHDPRTPENKRGKTSYKIALNIDIPATILDYARVLQPQGYQGKSLEPVVKNDNTEHWRENFLCEHRMGHEKSQNLSVFEGNDMSMQIITSKIRPMSICTI